MLTSPRNAVRYLKLSRSSNCDIRQSLSFSEAEYQEGHRLGKVCLVYMRDAEVPVLPRDFESDPEKLRALASFRALLQTRHTVATFRTRDDLAERVRSDVADSLTVVEAQETRRRESDTRRSAFFGQIQEIAVEAVNEGFKEALVLSAFRSALSDLRGRAPDLLTRFRLAFRNLGDLLSSAPPASQPWVFFSYAHADVRRVRAVAEELRRLHVRVWVDQQELIAGDSLVTEIQRGLERASALVFFASSASLESHWTRHELDYFLARRVSSAGGPRIIPVLIEDVELPALMRDILYVDMREGDAKRAALLIAASVYQLPVDELKARLARRLTIPFSRRSARR
jgi:hypothetical protein